MTSLPQIPAQLCALALLAISTGCVVKPPANPSPTQILEIPVLSGPHPVALVNLLRKGGYVIYIRHTKTDFSQKDITSDYDNCAGQRNLTDEGREQAKGIGMAFKALSIPVGRVVASPYCRTRETAQLAFGKYERASHYDTAKSMTKDILATVPADGPNTIIVAHGFIMRDIAHVILEEGDAVIFKPNSATDQGAIARVPASLLTAWAAGKADPPRAIVPTLQEYALPAGKVPHDAAPNADGTVWWTAQTTGELGLLDPSTGQSQLIALGAGSHPQGVIVGKDGKDGAAWVTDAGLNAIVRVDAKTHAIKVFALPANRANADLVTAAFDTNGALWFTGQSGIYGRLDVQTEKLDVWDAPKGSGPYGIAAAPDGSIYFASLAGNYIAHVDSQTGAATVIAPPTPNQGARRVWVDSKNKVWVSESNTGQISMYDSATKEWKAWPLPGPKSAQAYAMYVDAKDGAWVSDFANNVIINYSPSRREWTSYPLPSPNANVGQLLGHSVESWREIWGAESGTNKLVVIRAE